MILSWLIILCGGWHLQTLYSGAFKWRYASRLLTMFLIILLAFGYQSDDQNGSHGWILVGLCLSLIGDLLMVLPAGRFMSGLVTLFLAHFCYIIGITQAPMLLGLVDGLLLLLLAGLVFGRIWGRLGTQWWPVFCYTLMVIAMNWSAAAAWHSTLAVGQAAALVGAMMFFFSASVLALHRFYRPLYCGKAWVMMGYFAGQFLMAASLAA
ncbi:MAG: lysoplasmalogenase [Aeromonas sp.]